MLPKYKSPLPWAGIIWELLLLFLSSEMMWGEVRQGGPAPSVPSTERSVQAVRSLGTTRNLGTTTLCHSGGLWDRTLCPTTHMDNVVCVSTTTFTAGSFKCALQTSQGVSFAMWGAPWPLRGGAHVEAGVLPLLQHCVPRAEWSPLHSPALWCAWALHRSGISQQQGSGIPSQSAVCNIYYLCCDNARKWMLLSE